MLFGKWYKNACMECSFLDFRMQVTNDNMMENECCVYDMHHEFVIWMDMENDRMINDMRWQMVWIIMWPMLWHEMIINKVMYDKMTNDTWWNVMCCNDD